MNKVNKLADVILESILYDVDKAFNSEHLPVVFDVETDPEYFLIGFEMDGHIFERSASISEVIEFEIDNRKITKGEKQTDLRAFADSLKAHVKTIESAIKRLEVGDDH